MLEWTYRISGKQAGLTLAQVLRHVMGLSRTRVRSLRKRGRILVNGTCVFSRQVLVEGDLVQLLMPADPPVDLRPEPLTVPILYEDADLIVVDKPPGMLVHPARGELTGTLANGILGLWREWGVEAGFHPVHRLDRLTSGLVVVAKHSLAHQLLAQAINTGRVQRKYLAVVEGNPHPPAGTVRLPIARREDSLIQWEVRPGGKQAVTHYQTVDAQPGATLLQVWLETGRTHQIRVHFAHLGHPLLGDSLYGGSMDLLQRQALHAYHVVFPQPRTGEMVSLQSALPADFAGLLKHLGMIAARVDEVTVIDAQPQLVQAAKPGPIN